MEFTTLFTTLFTTFFVFSKQPVMMRGVLVSMILEFVAGAGLDREKTGHFHVTTDAEFAW